MTAFIRLVLRNLTIPTISHLLSFWLLFFYFSFSCILLSHFISCRLFYVLFFCLFVIADSLSTFLLFSWLQIYTFDFISIFFSPGYTSLLYLRHMVRGSTLSISIATDDSGASQYPITLTSLDDVSRLIDRASRQSHTNGFRRRSLNKMTTISKEMILYRCIMFSFSVFRLVFSITMNYITDSQYC